MWFVHKMKYYSTLKKKNSAICNSIYEFGGHCVKWYKPEGQILYDTTCIMNTK